jgi:hypothetical protein
MCGWAREKKKRVSSPSDINVTTFILGGATNRYKCEAFVPVVATARDKCPLTRARRGLLLLTCYKWPHLYQGKNTRYK